MNRPELLERLASRILEVRTPHPVRVAIDGVDGAGKTTLADDLAATLERAGRQVIRASIDGFHRPRADRHRRGRRSPEGYYHDSFDLALLRAALLDPLGPGGDRSYRSAAWDWRGDRPVDRPAARAASDAILVFDGVFLMRPELSACWDFRVFLHVDFRHSVARACARDATDEAGREALRVLYRDRYVPGQRLYLDACDPRARADVVIVNDDPDRPEWIAADGGGGAP